MIVVDDPETWLLITQPDHAHFSAELLSLFRTGGLPEHSRRTELLFAVREHDNGWRETDAAPRWNSATGRPHDFLTLPREERIDLWQRGTARYAGEHPYAALLITRHALQLHDSRRGQDGWQEFFDYLDELHRSLAEETGAHGEEPDYRWLDLADLLSLGVCNGCNRWREPFGRYGFQASLEDGTLHLDPFPLAGSTAFRIPCRRIPRRAYRGDADLGGELAAARWGELAVRVAPHRA
jgi:Protein of unknown function (DUF3891)